MPPRPFRAEEPYDWEGLLALIRSEFAYMDGRIDPPSSMHRLTAGDLARQAEEGEIWVIGAPAQACVVLTPKKDALYIGKLAVAGAQRGKGLARALVERAEERARMLGYREVELQVRVELVENQQAFAALGFRQVAATAHPGYSRPTSLTFRKTV